MLKNPPVWGAGQVGLSQLRLSNSWMGSAQLLRLVQRVNPARKIHDETLQKSSMLLFPSVRMVRDPHGEWHSIDKRMISILRFFGVRSGLALLSACMVFMLHLTAAAQTLGIEDRKVRVETLANTIVTMTGRSELHVSGSGDPISGSVIHLNSPDAWLFFTSLQPATVMSGLISRVRVNGVVAATSSNVRVVQHGNGSVVIPHGLGFTPLSVFTERRFAGSTLQIPLHAYYNNSNLGALAGNIQSFRLKRGYMATFARNENGTGGSRVFIAQDDDLDMTEMPASLGSNLRFVRVLPWRWVSKKGWAGSNESGFPGMVNAMWCYNWNNNENSVSNREYTPIRQTRWWPSYDITNAKENVTHLLGFNEPDSPEQANMTVAQAIAEWPSLMRSGLRLGSPAPTDGGLAWLYQFLDEAEALNYRVDFVAVHFYRGGQTATQLYNWLRDIHIRTGKPLWVTEWNNGANWTCCAPSSYEQQASIIKSFSAKMDEAPFVERYAIYNWLSGNRELIVNGALTAAGVAYRDHQSPIGHVDAPPLRLAGVYDEQSLQTNGVNQEMIYDGNVSWTTGVGQTLGAAQVLPLSQFKNRMIEAAASGFGGVVDFERGALHGGLLNAGAGFNAMFDDGRKSLDFTNRSANGGTYSISGPRTDRTAISGENSLSRSGTPNFDLEISNPRGFIRGEKVVSVGLTALGRTGVAGSNFFRFTAWYSNGTQNGSTSVRRQINTSTGNGSGDTFAGITAPEGYWITRIALNSENGVYVSIDDLAFITSLAPEFLWAPGGSAGGAGSWDGSAISWTTGDQKFAWSAGRVATFPSPGGLVDVAGPVAGVKGMLFEGAGYTLAGVGPLSFATEAEMMLNTNSAVLSTPLSGAGRVTVQAGAASNVLHLRGDNRNFSGSLSIRGPNQLRAYNSATGGVTGYELGGAAALIDLEAGSQARWFNLAASTEFASALRIAGNGSGGSNPGVLNLDTASARSVSFGGAVTLSGAATVATQNQGGFIFNGPLAGAFPLSFNVSPNTVTRVNGSADLGQIIKSGSGALAFGSAAVLRADSLTLNAGSLQIAPTSQLALGELVLNVGLSLAVPETLSFAFPVSGPGSISKSGAGTLKLAAANRFGPLGGTFSLGSGSTSAGYVRLSHPQALGNHSRVALNSSQAGTSGLELEGGHRFTASLDTAGRSAATGSGFALRNVSGNNTWDGAVTLTATGGSYGFLSDSGTLAIAGELSSSVANDTLGARGVQFAGAGDIRLKAAVRRSGELSSQNLAISHAGPGTLILEAGGDHSGSTQVSGGTLQVDGTLTASNVIVGVGGRLAGSGRLPSASISGRLALVAGQVPLTVAGALNLQNGAILEISGMPVSGPQVMARFGSRSGNFTSVIGVPEGWRLDENFESGTALALVAVEDFAVWAAAQGLADASFNGDSDGDGLANGLEYAVAGLRPNVADAFPGVFSGRRLSFLKRPEALANGDVEYGIEISTSLAADSWVAVRPEIDNEEVISHVLPTDHPRVFARLVVRKSR
jgi:autotransporter-associated beta strand protein